MSALFLHPFLLLTICISNNCLSQHLDSVQFNPYNNFESVIPPIQYNLDELPRPTLFILDDKELKGDKFSELEISKKILESITIIQDNKELEDIGYGKFRSVVLLKSKIEDSSN